MKKTKNHSSQIVSLAFIHYLMSLNNKNNWTWSWKCKLSKKSGIFSPNIAIFDYFWNEKTKNNSSHIVYLAFIHYLMSLNNKNNWTRSWKCKLSKKKWDFQSKNSHFWLFLEWKNKKSFLSNCFSGFHTISNVIEQQK